MLNQTITEVSVSKQTLQTAESVYREHSESSRRHMCQINIHLTVPH